jgi:hypothetical protein
MALQSPWSETLPRSANLPWITMFCHKKTPKLPRNDSPKPPIYNYIIYVKRVTTTDTSLSFPRKIRWLCVVIGTIHIHVPGPAYKWRKIRILELGEVTSLFILLGFENQSGGSTVPAGLPLLEGNTSYPTLSALDVFALSIRWDPPCSLTLKGSWRNHSIRIIYKWYPSTQSFGILHLRKQPAHGVVQGRTGGARGFVWWGVWKFRGRSVPGCGMSLEYKLYGTWHFWNLLWNEIWGRLGCKDSSNWNSIIILLSNESRKRLNL